MSTTGKTADADGKIHCYDDQPVHTITGDAETFAWFDHGVFHRDDNKPALITKHKNEIISQEHQVRGFLHCETGPALYYSDADGKEEGFYLYRYQLEKEDFENVTTRSASEGIPLWVAWLIHLKRITDEDVKPFYGEDGTWVSTLPHTWFLKMWNINQTTYAPDDDVDEVEEDWKAFIAILDHQASKR